MSSTSLGPLSWQQTENLRRNARMGIRTDNVGGTFTVGSDDSVSVLRERLARIVAREEALRIVGLDGGDDAQGATYADEIELGFDTVSRDSADEAIALVNELLDREFRHDTGPLWNLTVISSPDRAGMPSGTACLVMDHHIADHHTLLLLRDELSGVDDAVRALRRGGYRDWVSWQRQQYPMGSAAATPSRARDFWRRYFDEGAPNHATILSFCHPDVPVSGVECVTSRDLPATGDQLRAAGAGLGATQFLVFTASITSAIGASAAATDTTLRYVTHGRTPRVLATLGWFCDSMSLRVRTPALAEPHEALKAAAASRLEIIEFEMTPFGYIMEVCGQTDRERPQVTLNLLQMDDETVAARPRPTRPASGGAVRTPGTRGDLPPDLNFLALVPRAELCRLECRYDRARFTPDGVEAFMDLVCEHFRRIVEADGRRLTGVRS